MKQMRFTLSLMALAVVLALAVGLFAGCAGPGGAKQDLSVHQRIEAACSGTATALAVLTVANDHDQLTKAQGDKVDEARKVLKPTCKPASGDYPYTMEEAALEALEQSAAYVKGLKPKEVTP
jgi:hypothetical protein